MASRERTFAGAYIRLWNFVVLTKPEAGPACWQRLAQRLNEYQAARCSPSRPARRIDHGPGTGKRVQYLPTRYFADEMQRLDPYVESRYEGGERGE